MGAERIIVDCYSDEPAGLGVPPFLGVWPRYVAGSYRETPTYLTIDDLRAATCKITPTEHFIDSPTKKTKIEFLNLTRDIKETQEILRKCKQAIFTGGVHTPGKYLSARPGTIKEVLQLASRFKLRKILAGPAAIVGTQTRGGNRPELADHRRFAELRGQIFGGYDELRRYAIDGAAILTQIPQRRIVEIETGRGCPRSEGCSFCTEPLKGNAEWRKTDDIIDEMSEFTRLGADAFRLGKQSCLLSYHSGDTKALGDLLRRAAELNAEVLHMDNASPAMVNDERIQLCVKYLTPGSTAAMGAESFDMDVIAKNNLNSNFDEIYEASKIINRYGAERSENGCHTLLPGINIVLGLIGETRETLDINFKCLKTMLDSGLLIRRINIRQVVPFPGTKLDTEAGNKFLKKNRRFYNKWARMVREEIDMPMLKRLFPEGTVLKDLYSETHEGNVTFLRQLASYPIVVGTRNRLPLGKRYDMRITGHNLRSLSGEPV